MLEHKKVICLFVNLIWDELSPQQDLWFTSKHNFNMFKLNTFRFLNNTNTKQNTKITMRTFNIWLTQFWLNTFGVLIQTSRFQFGSKNTFSIRSNWKHVCFSWNNNIQLPTVSVFRQHVQLYRQICNYLVGKCWTVLFSLVSSQSSVWVSGVFSPVFRLW